MFSKSYVILYAVLFAVFLTAHEVHGVEIQRNNTNQICNLVFKNLNNSDVEEYSANVMSSVENDANLRADICHLIVALNPSLLLSEQSFAPPITTTTTEAITIDKKPVHVTVLPTQSPVTTTTPKTTTTRAPTKPPTTNQIPVNENPSIPLFADQINVFPTTVNEQQQQQHDAIHIIEESLKTHPNGTLEYKLVLSNGVIDYKRTTMKVVNGSEVMVQEGYNTAPLSIHSNQFQTQHYVSNEKGHHVYKVEQHVRNT